MFPCWHGDTTRSGCPEITFVYNLKHPICLKRGICCLDNADAVYLRLQLYTECAVLESRRTRPGWVGCIQSAGRWHQESRAHLGLYRRRKCRRRGWRHVVVQLTALKDKRTASSVNNASADLFCFQALTSKRSLTPSSS